MKQCYRCGFQMFERETKCPNCGYGFESKRGRGFGDKTSIFLVIVSFLIPIVGLLLAIFKKSTQPHAAKSYLIAAIIGWVVAAVSWYGMSDRVQRMYQDYQYQQKYYQPFKAK